MAGDFIVKKYSAKVTGLFVKTNRGREGKQELGTCR
jgi:hypothetical protein